MSCSKRLKHLTRNAKCVADYTKELEGRVVSYPFPEAKVAHAFTIMIHLHITGKAAMLLLSEFIWAA
jgi:hypothetical protein